MNTYRTQSSFAEVDNGASLSEATLAYFRERQRGRIHELVITEFLKTGMTKADFARRIGRDPSQITRWMANPGNWELDTISDFLLGIGGGELDPQVAYPARTEEVQEQEGPDWLSEPAASPYRPIDELATSIAAALEDAWKNLSQDNPDGAQSFAK